MQREIKFRAWDKEKKQMIYDFDQDIAKKGYPVKLGGSINNMVYNVGLAYGTLMQYTGLKDKEGKEIYEGDILEYSSDGFHKSIGDVIINDGSVRCRALYFHQLSYTVMPLFLKIGNIHDNPELLNK